MLRLAGRERQWRARVRDGLAAALACGLLLAPQPAGSSMAPGPAHPAAAQAAAVPLWFSGPGATSFSWRSGDGADDLAGLAERLLLTKAGESARPRARSVNGSAFLTGLMSAVLPGAGQVRNGSYLRGFGYLAAEVTGWVAYTALRQGGNDKTGEMERFSAQYWSYEHYHTRAPDQDSCQAYECPCNAWTEERDSEIAGAIASGNSSRFLEYVGRDVYACGWDSPVSRSVYLSLWDDREDLRSARNWSSRLIFLNHLVSAVDAFLEARAIRLQVDSATQVRFDVRGLPFHARAEIRVTRRFG